MSTRRITRHPKVNTADLFPAALCLACFLVTSKDQAKLTFSCFAQPDLSHCTRLLLLKAQTWARAGRPAKGLSIALRAAAAARSRYMLPLLWEAVVALGEILVDVEEFGAVRDLVGAVMPQVMFHSLPCA